MAMAWRSRPTWRAVCRSLTAHGHATNTTTQPHVSDAAVHAFSSSISPHCQQNRHYCAPSQAIVDPAPPFNVHKLKKQIQDPQTSFAKAYEAYVRLCQHKTPLFEREFLSLIAKSTQSGQYDTTIQLFNDYCNAEATKSLGTSNALRRGAHSWQLVSFHRQQMVRFVLWSMLMTTASDANTMRHRMIELYRDQIHNKPNRHAIYECDPYNFLLRMECMGRFAGQPLEDMKLRADRVLQEMEKRRFHVSYSSAHAFFRFVLYHPELFVSDNEETSLADAVIGYFDAYPIALDRNPKRLSLAVSAAAVAGHYEVVIALIQDASAKQIALDAAAFAHALTSTAADTRQEITALYKEASSRRNGLYTTANEEASISNYLLLYAIYDGQWSHTLEMLAEMQYYNNQASNKTVEELFKSVARARAASSDKDMVSIWQLMNQFPNVIQRTVHTLSVGVLESLKAGDLEDALTILRTTVWSTDVVLRPEMYAQVLYPLLAMKADTKRVVELEKLFATQHPNQRRLLHAQVVNLCETNDDLETLLTVLSRWQTLQLPRMSKVVFNRVFNVVSKQLAKVSDRMNQTAYVVVDQTDRLELSYRGLLSKYAEIVPPSPAWTISAAIIRSATSELHEDVKILLQEATHVGLALEKAAYKVGIEVLCSDKTMNEDKRSQLITNCINSMQQHNVLDAFAAHYPETMQLIAQ